MNRNIYLLYFVVIILLMATEMVRERKLMQGKKAGWLNLAADALLFIVCLEVANRTCDFIEYNHLLIFVAIFLICFLPFYHIRRILRKRWGVDDGHRWFFE